MSTFDALSQGYSTRRNVPYADTTTTTRSFQSLLFLIKQALLDAETGGVMSAYARPAASKCTLIACSDGVSVSTVTDLWGTTFNAAKLVMAAPGTAHSWFVVQNTTHQILLDMCSTSPGTFRWSVTPIAHPFNTGAATVANAPLAVGYEWSFNNHSEGAGTSAAMTSDLTISTTHNFHFIAGDDGQFFVLTNRVASLQGFSEFWWFGKSVDATSGTTAWWTVQQATASARGAPSISLITGSSVTGRNAGGVLVASGGFGPNPTFGGVTIAGTYGTDTRSGKYGLWKFEVIACTPTYETLGLAADLYLASTPPPFSPIPSVAATQRIVAGEFVVPWTDGAPTP